jgi:O-antigen/teichoic acid export membrane protein
MPRFAIALLLALIVSVALSLAAYAAMPYAGVSWPTWYSAFRTVSQSLIAVAPGFVAGWYAGRDGMILGTLVAVITSIGGLIFIWFWWGPLPIDKVAVSLVFGTVASIITQAIAGLTGEFVRRQRPLPNNSFKPKPLRGSA